jgi:hypothetical protein
MKCMLWFESRLLSHCPAGETHDLGFGEGHPFESSSQAQIFLPFTSKSPKFFPMATLNIPQPPPVGLRFSGPLRPGERSPVQGSRHDTVTSPRGRLELRGRIDVAAPQSNSAVSSGIATALSALATASLLRRPEEILSPFRRCGSSRSACLQPLSASAKTNGSVALFSANVEVRGTAPGMLVTQ